MEREIEVFTDASFAPGGGVSHGCEVFMWGGCAVSGIEYGGGGVDCHAGRSGDGRVRGLHLRGDPGEAASSPLLQQHGGDLLGHAEGGKLEDQTLEGSGCSLEMEDGAEPLEGGASSWSGDGCRHWDEAASACEIGGADPDVGTWMHVRRG